MPNDPILRMACGYVDNLRRVLQGLVSQQDAIQDEINVIQDQIEQCEGVLREHIPRGNELAGPISEAFPPEDDFAPIPEDEFAPQDFDGVDIDDYLDQVGATETESEEELESRRCPPPSSEADAMNHASPSKFLKKR